MGTMEKNEETSGMMSLMADKLAAACDQHGRVQPTIGTSLADGPRCGQAQNDADGRHYSALPDDWTKMGQSGPGNRGGATPPTTKMLKKFFSPEQAEAIAEAAGEETESPRPTEASAGGKRGV